MIDRQEIIKKLHDLGDDLDKKSTDCLAGGDTCYIAADLIKKLSAECDHLEKQLAASERRAEAAVEDLKQSEHDNGKCDYCRHRAIDGGCASIPVPYSFCSKVNRWEWRGAEKGAES